MTARDDRARQSLTKTAFSDGGAGRHAKHGPAAVKACE